MIRINSDWSTCPSPFISASSIISSSSFSVNLIPASSHEVCRSSRLMVPFFSIKKHNILYSNYQHKHFHTGNICHCNCFCSSMYLPNVYTLWTQYINLQQYIRFLSIQCFILLYLRLHTLSTSTLFWLLRVCTFICQLWYLLSHDNNYLPV